MAKATRAVKREALTTGQAARICEVAPRTVSKWCNSDRLQCYRIPGSLDRRIPRERLLAFLREHDMRECVRRLQAFAGAAVLAVGCDPLTAGRLRDRLAGDPWVRFADAPDAFEAGRLAAELSPERVVVDLGVGRAAAVAMAANLRRLLPAVELVALATEDDPAAAWAAEAGYDVLARPLDPAVLAGRLAAA